MGKQLEGDFLEWPHDKEAIKRVKDKALQQLLALWNEGIKKTSYTPYWGDEIEYAILRLKKNRTTVALKQNNVLNEFEEKPNGAGEFTAEFASYMVEGMPSKPYGPELDDLLKVEESMENRRAAVKAKLEDDEFPFTLSMFPRLGVEDAIDLSDHTKTPKGTESKPSFPEDVISTEARYQAAFKNIPARRGSGPPKELPKFQDKNTSKGPIVLEGSIFGGGHCGLQATFQASDLNEARMLHDQLIPLGPIMLALTAATPIYKGYLSDVDARWDQIAHAVDDRSAEEKEDGEESILPRWFSNTTYLAEDIATKKDYQFQSLRYDQDVYKRLREDCGFNHLLARHFAHVFIRDPIMISSKEVEVTSPDPKDVTDTTCFDSLNDSIWPHVRLKIPPLGQDAIGWRVEFRPMELQLTDSENAAFCIFMALIRRVITDKKLNFYIPLEAVKENMEKAQKRDAVSTEKFRFRVNYSGEEKDSEPEFADMTVNEIINGNEKTPGLVPLIENYLWDYSVCQQSKELRVISALKPYLDLVKKRASGDLWTGAKWMREFVKRHEDYRDDSAVSKKICHDLVEEIKDLAEKKGRDGSNLF